MPLETPTYINDFVVTNPEATDVVEKGDDHIRNAKTALKNTLPNADRAWRFPEAVAAKTTSYAVLSTDENKLIPFDATSGALTPTLPAVASLPDGWMVTLKKVDSSTNTVTVDPNGSETIDGGLTVVLEAQYDSVTLFNTGSAWLVVGRPRHAGEWSFFIERAQDKAYELKGNLGFDGKILSITTECESGSCTLTGKIESTNLGGTANAVSTSEQTQAHSSNNTFVAGNDFTLTVSSNSSCLGIRITVKFWRTPK